MHQVSPHWTFVFFPKVFKSRTFYIAQNVRCLMSLSRSVASFHFRFFLEWKFCRKDWGGQGQRPGKAKHYDVCTYCLTREAGEPGMRKMGTFPRPGQSILFHKTNELDECFKIWCS